MKTQQSSTETVSFNPIQGKIPDGTNKIWTLDSVADASLKT